MIRVPRFLFVACLCVGPVLGGCDDRGAAEAHSPSSSEQEVVLITGSTDGLGRELALRMASGGAHVIVHGRNEERGREVVRLIEEEGLGSARFIAADLASLDEVRRLAGAVLEDYDRLDILINNAGVGPGAPGHERVLTPDGHELRFQVNYLSHFLLTRLLLPLLGESAPARIVNVSSRGQAPIDFDDLRLDGGYSGGEAYRRSKLAQILFTFDLNEALEGTGVSVYAVHPAPAMATGLVAEVGAQPQSTVDEGADAVMRVVTGTGLEGGQYFHEGEPARAHEQAYDREARERLRGVSEELTGVESVLPTRTAPPR